MAATLTKLSSNTLMRAILGAARSALDPTLRKGLEFVCVLCKFFVVETATITVRDPVFWLRLATQGDLGFAEAFMYGEVDCLDLTALFEVLLDNRSCLSEIDTLLAKASRVVERFCATNLVNNLANARQNISAHYDISNEMFMAFLSGDMTYSCAIFPELDTDLHESPLPTAASESSADPSAYSSTASPSSSEGTLSGVKISQASTRISEAAVRRTRDKDDDAELCDAQIRKMLHIVKRADIRPGHRVLEIGSGWGSMAICMAQAFPGVTVDTLTLSEEQAHLARQRVAEIGLGPRPCQKVRVHLMDYRSMPKEWEGIFDRIVSVEMVEAVGQEFLETYWARIDWALKRDTGVGVVQGITLPEARFEAYVRDTDFIRKWVFFPGGFLPTLSLLISTMTSGSKGRLIVDSVDNIGPHYARTLREWRRRFENRFDAEIVPALRKQYADVLSDGAPGSQEEIEVFRRKWLYYFAYCEVGFASRSLGDHIVTFTREGHVEYGCQVLGSDVDVE
ncbi:Mycolic acid cyclopropane synthetase-domain-containing protein [Rhodofomes roseus]|uniref:Mycolic acid cyclopropane synthetase-domain-containing protein n=1 Tax=Rhodofomes roseus TaxID=34475 RepID=A0ABQ8KRP8_9APHY|nr:Mycolic acid cyclopropane synthetase-domain-containing protein [Rhodofomes roseus]KAH9841488.1 Mycolic acid cyclopropane synthetase-domain-containing protein [Rhodofomes roseus]